MTITPTQLKDHVETDLVTTALQTLIDDADKEIERRFGSNSSVREEHTLEAPEGFESPFASGIGRRRIYTKQKISSVTALTEGPTLATADQTTLVADAETNGYRIILNGFAIERIGTDFDKRVIITYVPVTDVKRRDRVVIDLCKLAIQYDALRNQRIGDWNGSYPEYQKEREAILLTLIAGRRFLA